MPSLNEVNEGRSVFTVLLATHIVTEAHSVITLCASLLRASKKADPEHFNRNLVSALRVCERWSEIVDAGGDKSAVGDLARLTARLTVKDREGARGWGAHRPRRSWADLPVEIIQLIMREVRPLSPSNVESGVYEGAWREQPASLVRCTAVCRGGEPAASRVLWEVVKIGSIRSLRRFALASVQCSVRDPEGREGAERVRYLSIDVTDEAPDFAALVTSMAPRLSNLAVYAINTFQTPFQLPFSALAAYFKPPSKNLVAFHFQGEFGDFEHGSQGPVAADFAAVEAGIGKLKVLELTKGGTGGWTPSFPRASSLGARSPHLRRVDFSQCAGITDEIFTNLLTSSPLIDQVTLKRNDHVTDISIAHLQHHHRPLIRLVLHGMPHLSEPTVRNLFLGKSAELLTLDIGNNTWVSGEVLNALARHAHKLENLQLVRASGLDSMFDVPADSTLSRKILWIVFTLGSTMPRLRRVGCDIVSEELDDGEWKQLEEAGLVLGTGCESPTAVDLLRLARVTWCRLSSVLRLK
ncbi:hypothetical protein BDK51DRAFT_28408 [Blyttiomyces helicus]|uniref:F-box domain-containing protein n=1 Tax=Blyttiomyces helicus TaxID=388810 RepID=A0A4P9WLE8_9FUNG|nr:hypothetical protein BDK51DRAFT_28408 [Blyttiomyces helicus]|eukprot:RKO92995.1 hypothetical protein BDK51DRAFT_28408 [Blyttiomyces helicus]